MLAVSVAASYGWLKRLQAMVTELSTSLDKAVFDLQVARPAVVVYVGVIQECYKPVPRRLRNVQGILSKYRNMRSLV
jgi:hypothetical protein